MEPTVLAGPIQFSPAEIALALTVIALAALVVSAPGWLPVAYATGRRPGPQATGATRWWARIGGALVGMGVFAVTARAVGAVLDRLDFAAVLAVGGGWAACWALAALLWRPQSRRATAPPPGPPAPPRDASTPGWGR